MIKEFKIYENMSTDYIVGIPSGEVIYINSSNINMLKYTGNIRFDSEISCFIFTDNDRDDVLSIIKKSSNNIKPATDNQRAISYFMSLQKNVEHYSINSRGVSVVGSIYINGGKHKFFPFTFYSISGDFIFKNSELESLKGGPNAVGGDFIVSGNGLFDLVGGPSYVGRDYDCSNNFINYLTGSPDIIKGNFDCSDNFLQNLEDGPSKVDGYLDCSSNSLKYGVEYPDCKNLIMRKK